MGECFFGVHQILSRVNVRFSMQYSLCSGKLLCSFIHLHRLRNMSLRAVLVLCLFFPRCFAVFYVCVWHWEFVEFVKLCNFNCIELGRKNDRMSNEKNMSFAQFFTPVSSFRLKRIPIFLFKCKLIESCNTYSWGGDRQLQTIFRCDAC